MHSTIENVQLLAQYLKKAEISEIIISPGSRNSPLIIEFSEDPYFNCYSIVDERSAAYFALGKAQQMQSPVAVCCSSGSAVANYYPAVTEAFYQNVPLLLLTADRPEDYIDIFDGQTIRQNHIFQQHSYGNYQLSEKGENILSENKTKIKKALDDCFNNKGPVHINLPFSEPLYNTDAQAKNYEVDYTKPIPQFEDIDFEALKKSWYSYDKKMILCGILPPQPNLQKAIYAFAKEQNAVILSETTSNLEHPNIFNTIDALIFPFSEEKFAKYAPEIVLTVGQNVVSKKIKQLLRNTNLKAHWHLDEYWSANTFFQLSEYYKQDKTSFLEVLYGNHTPSDYYKLWQNLKKESKIMKIQKLENTPFSDLYVYDFLYKNLEPNTQLQFANSSAIRYSQLFPFNMKHQVFCNRGTSGIDGSVATAIGAATSNKLPTVLITGDIGFFYESNSLWNNYISQNFKIILINNNRGEIFNFIAGPKSIPAKDTYLTTTHNRTARYVSEEFGLDYFTVKNSDELEGVFSQFISNEKISLLEIDTSLADNSTILKDYLS